MRFVWVIMLVVGLSFGAVGVECAIAPDKMAVVEGERTFILGLYENPKDDAILKQVADAGFNLVRASESAASLDRLQAQGLWAWLNTGMRIDLSQQTEKRQTDLQTMISNHGNHPALLVWEVPDEALWNCWYGATQWRRTYEPPKQRELIEKLDDTALADTLRAQQRQVQKLYNQAEYLEADTLADSIWTQLGKTPPKPGYGISNAAERAATMAGGMLDGYTLIRQADPAHPIWMNHAPRNQIAQLAAFNKAADMVGCDIYPVPRSKRQKHSDLENKTLSSVGAFTDRMQAAAPGKPVWMVLQGFGWADLRPKATEEEIKELRRPNLKETRFMAFDTIVHGARGILYWGTYKVERPDPFWDDLLAVVRELADLQPVLSAPDATMDIAVSFEESYGSVDRSVLVLPKQVGDQVWLLVVNEAEEPLQYHLDNLFALEGCRYRDTQTGKEAVVENGRITLRISAVDTQVL